MESAIYPLAIIALGILFYLFGKESTVEEPIFKSIPTKMEKKSFEEETEEEFTTRCFLFITYWFVQNDIQYYVSNDKTSFKVSFEDSDGDMADYFIETYFSTNKKIIMFHTRSNISIPNTKLIYVSEFINRMNQNLLIGSLYLNYETRKIDNRLIYYVGNSELSVEQFEFNYGTLLGVKIKHSLIKIIENHENPAIVAMDWPN